MNTTTAPQTTILFPNLFKALSEEVKKRTTETIQEINQATLIADLNHWRFTDHLPKSKKITDFATLQDLQLYLISRVKKQATKNIQSKLNHLLEIEQAAEFKYFNISVEWKRSATWGANPRGEGYDYNGRYNSGSIGGCGYDKLSTAVANVLNQSAALLKALYLEREKDTESKLQAVYGYGSGYGILPRFEGGVGVSCYPSIFDKIGFTFRQTASGKSFDAFEVTKKA